MKVRWLLMKTGKSVIRTSRELDDLSAIAEFAKRVSDPFVERVDLICDKSDGYHVSLQALRDAYRSEEDW